MSNVIMRRIMLGLSIALLTFFIGVASIALLLFFDTTTVSTEIATEFVMKEMTDDSFEPVIPTFTICELSKAPYAHWGKLVRVRAILVADATRLEMDLFEAGCYGGDVWMDASIDYESGLPLTSTDGLEESEDRARERFEDTLVDLLGNEVAHRPFVAEVELVGAFSPYEYNSSIIRVFIIKLSRASLWKGLVPKRPYVDYGPC